MSFSDRVMSVESRADTLNEVVGAIVVFGLNRRQVRAQLWASR